MIMRLQIRCKPCCKCFREDRGVKLPIFIVSRLLNEQSISPPCDIRSLRDNLPSRSLFHKIVAAWFREMLLRHSSKSGRTTVLSSFGNHSSSGANGEKGATSADDCSSSGGSRGGSSYSLG